jgi:hypothetical protein
MTDKAKEARRAYKRKWAKENPDKIRAQQERYWNKKAEQAEAAERDAQATARQLPY